MLQYEGTCGKDHELLHGQFVSSMAASIDNIECWDWQNDLLVSGKIGYVTVEGDSLEKENDSQFYWSVCCLKISNKHVCFLGFFLPFWQLQLYRQLRKLQE